MNPQDKQLTDLLERWQSGNFTSTDEQTLRRLLAERDDFRQEAAEGLLAFPDDDHAARVSRLRQKLRPERDRKTIPLRTWLTLAASLTALVVAAWWLTPGAQQESAIAQQAPAPTTTLPSTELPPPPPGVASTSTTPASRNPQTRLQDTPVGAASEESVATYSNASEAAGVAPLVDDQLALELAKEEEPATKKSDAANSPIVSQPAVVSAPAPSQPNYAEAKDEKVSAKKSKASRTLPAPQRNADFGNNDSNNNISQSPAGTAIAYPAQGWTTFNTYLRNNARLTPEAKKAGLKKGKVVLNLVLGTDGSIQQVGVVQGLGYGCDELAERLGRGSKWVLPASATPYFNVEVPFEQ